MVQMYSKVLLTGSAGFVGYHTAKKLLESGIQVVGVDLLTPYYDPELKKARLDHLRTLKGFEFYQQDICSKESLESIFKEHGDIDAVIHLAAQAGVRYSLEAPETYTHTNFIGTTNLLEVIRHKGTNVKHTVIASSSSVYGANKKLPFSASDMTDTPISLYAATKKATELAAHSYSHLFAMPITCLRYFTVYGPWGRPDMAAFLFTNKILKGQPIDVYNQGKMKRNFSYIDDIVNGTILSMKNAPEGNSESAAFRVLNIANDKTVSLEDFISAIESATGQKAIKNYMPLQPGDVPETLADVTPAKDLIGYEPHTDLEDGIKKFVSWYTDYYTI